MITLRASLELHTAFGTPLAGDTLFGHICWAVREQLGNTALTQLLVGYTAGRPWLVVSDGFPADYLPRPTVPASLVGANLITQANTSSVGANSFAQNTQNRSNTQRVQEPLRGELEPTKSAPTKLEPINQAMQRKAEKAKHWIKVADIAQPLSLMLAAAVNDKIAFKDNKKPVEAPQPHNTLNRLTGTTGEGDFAPYTQPQIFFASGQCMDVYCVLDETRLSLEYFYALLQAVGSQGYGRDASIGLGKFSVKTILPVGANSFAQSTQSRSNEFEPTKPETTKISVLPVGANSFAQHAEANAYLTLAPCAPQGQCFDSDRSYWRVLTRFGCHGNLHGISEKPFKNPVLLAATGAVFVPQAEYTPRPFIGQGLGGNGQISKVEQGVTVHQGYAPVVGIKMEV